MKIEGDVLRNIPRKYEGMVEDRIISVYFCEIVRWIANDYF